MEKTVQLEVTKFDWKQIILQRLAIHLKVGINWLKIISVNTKLWDEYHHFPLLSGTVIITYLSIEAELELIDDDPSALDEFINLHNTLTRDEIISKYFEQVKRKYPADELNFIYQLTLNHFEINQIPPIKPPQSSAIEQDVIMCDLLANIQPKSVSDFTQLRSIHCWSIPTKFTHIEQIFDAFQVSDKCPVVSWNGFFKFASSPTQTWKFEKMPNIIECKLVQNLNYFNCIVQLKNSKLEWVIEDFDESFKTPDIIPQLLNQQFDQLDNSAFEFGGECYILNSFYQHPILAHFLFQKFPFNKLLFFDDSIKIDISKSANYIYCHLPGTTDIQKAHIKTINDANILINFQNQGQVIDAFGIHVNIHKTKSNSNKDYFLLLLSVLFAAFQEDEDKIQEKYFKLKITVPLPKFPEASKNSSEVKLKTRLPHIFLTDYPTRCNHAPTLIDSIDEIQDGEYSLTFPSPEDARSKGVRTNLFVCRDHNKFPFPGLMVNQLENKDKYPCLPCCYKADQMQTEDSNLRRYITDGSCRNKIVEKSSEILKKQGLLTFGSQGKLPPFLVKVFYSIFESFDFKRVGCENDFVNCLLRALDPTKPINKIIEERKNFPQGHATDIWQTVSRMLKMNVWIWCVNGLVRPTGLPFVDHYYNKEWPACHIYQNFGNESRLSKDPAYELILDVSDAAFFSEKKQDTFINLAQEIWAYQTGTTKRQPIFFKLEKTPPTKQFIDAFGACHNIEKKFRMPRAPYDIRSESFPFNSIEMQPSKYQKWLQISRLAREILWNGIWLSFQIPSHKLTKDHILFSNDVKFEPSFSLPNNTLISDFKLLLPMSEYNSQLPFSICQTVNLNRTKTKPTVIPNYFQNLADFKHSPNSYMSMIWPPNKLPIEQAPAFDNHSFWIKLEDDLWVAQFSSHSPGDNSIIWAYHELDPVKYHLNSDPQHPPTYWLVVFKSNKKIWFSLQKFVFSNSH